MATNRIREEMLKNARKAAVSTATVFPRTIATSVYLSDNTTIEVKDLPTVDPEDPTKPLPDERVKPVDIGIAASQLSAQISQCEDNAVVGVTGDGNVSGNISIEKGITLEGANAGIAQNFNQEV